MRQRKLGARIESRIVKGRNGRSRNDGKKCVQGGHWDKLGKGEHGGVEQKEFGEM